MISKILLLRTYDVPSAAPDNSFLVDRLWPRGISKQKMQGVIWLKDVAPSTELRQWFHQNSDRFMDFRQRYLDELSQTNSWQPLRELLLQGKTITLLYSSKDRLHNQAVVLRDFLASE